MNEAERLYDQSVKAIANLEESENETQSNR